MAEVEEEKTGMDLVLASEHDAATAEDFITNLMNAHDEKRKKEQEIREIEHAREQYYRDLRLKYYKKAKITLDKIWNKCKKRKLGHNYVNKHIANTGVNIDVCSICGAVRFYEGDRALVSMKYADDMVLLLSTKLYDKDKQAGLIPEWEETVQGIKMSVKA